MAEAPATKKIGRRVFYDIADLEEFANQGTVETIESMTSFVRDRQQ